MNQQTKNRKVELCYKRKDFLEGAMINVDFYNKISWLTHYINDVTTIKMNSNDLNTLMDLFKGDLNETTVC